jgi:hypothetical protein
MPLAFVLGSQVCGIGLSACTVYCNIFTLISIDWATLIAVQIYRGKKVGILLIPILILGLFPHCICHAPINVIWKQIFNGYSPTCGMVPTAVVLFAVTTLKGIRPKLGTIMVLALLGIIVFMAVGNYFFGFPWHGCV